MTLNLITNPRMTFEIRLGDLCVSHGTSENSAGYHSLNQHKTAL